MKSAERSCTQLIIFCFFFVFKFTQKNNKKICSGCGQVADNRKLFLPSSFYKNRFIFAVKATTTE